MKKLVLFFLSVILAGALFAQPDTLQKTNVSFGGFLDVYYGFDFNRPENGDRPGFLYNHTRHNEVNLNLGLAQVRVDGGNYRANLGLMAGNYPQANLAAEPELLKNIYEANAGISLSKNRAVWLDAGIFGSHIGFESAISSDNPTLTRSLLAENSPYYLSGVKLSWQPGEKWQLALLALNGWQRIRRVPGNQTPALGTQVRYANDKIVLNWSTFAGTEDPDSTRRIRVFNNFYGQFRLTGKWSLTAGLDIGVQQKRKGHNGMSTWFSPVLIARYAIDDRWAVAFRGEYYQDENGVIIAANSGESAKITGISTNLDFALNQNVLIRLEGRWLTDPGAIFTRDQNPVKNDLYLCGSVAVKIQ